MLNCSGNWVSKKSDPTRSQSPPVHDLTEEDEERIEKLFKTLDLDGNGKIDIHDLSVSLKESGVSPMYAKVKRKMYIFHIFLSNLVKNIQYDHSL